MSYESQKARFHPPPLQLVLMAVPLMPPPGTLISINRKENADKAFIAFIHYNYILFSFVIVSAVPETKVPPATTGL